MVKLKALLDLTGTYGTVHEGDVFTVDEETATALEERGLACRYHEPRSTPQTYQTKVLVPEDPNKRRRDPRA